MVLTGNLILKSSRVRTLDDLRGTITMAFRETDAQAIPLISQIGRFAPGLRVPSADFQRGMLRGDIGQGYLRIRDLNLWGDQLFLQLGSDPVFGLRDAKKGDGGNNRISCPS